MNYNQSQDVEYLKERLDLLQGIVQLVPIGIFQIDENNQYTFVNPAWESTANCSLTKALGKNWWEVIHPDDQKMALDHWEQAAKDMKEISIECRIIKKDGKVGWIRLQSKFLFDDMGKKTIGSMENITIEKNEAAQRENLIADLTETKKQLEISSRTDPLTNLLNRRGMEEHLSAENKRMMRKGKPFSMILCDIDFFKKVNDDYGHDAGDYILTQVASNIEKASREQDVVCRWGGEEFLLMLPETETSGAAILAEKLRKETEKNVQIFKGQKIMVTLSMGVACMENGQQVDECIKQADLKLYSAKNEGRNKVVA